MLAAGKGGQPESGDFSESDIDATKKGSDGDTPHHSHFTFLLHF
jgi:hypothetical protein